MCISFSVDLSSIPEVTLIRGRVEGGGPSSLEVLDQLLWAVVHEGQVVFIGHPSEPSGSSLIFSDFFLFLFIFICG